MLAFNNVTVRYGRHVAVDGVSLEARPGEVLALVGPNGSGKSSLLKAAANLVPSEGAIALPPASQGARPIGYMPQDTVSHAALTVLEAVLLGRHRTLGLALQNSDLAAAVKALNDLGIASLADRYLGELSGGQRQLVFLAQAIAGRPQVLLLDEPISALDIHHQLHVLETVKRITVEQGLTTIMVLHDLTVAARHADKVALLSEGRLVSFGKPLEALTINTIRDVFQVEATIAAAPDLKPVIVATRCVHPSMPDAR